MAAKVVIENAILRGSHDELLQKVANVYVNGEEIRVLASPAKGNWERPRMVGALVNTRAEQRELRCRKRASEQGLSPDETIERRYRSHRGQGR
jgi:hypothetical protein